MLVTYSGMFKEFTVRMASCWLEDDDGAAEGSWERKMWLVDARSRRANQSGEMETLLQRRGRNTAHQTRPSHESHTHLSPP